MEVKKEIISYLEVEFIKYLNDLYDKKSGVH